MNHILFLLKKADSYLPFLQNIIAKTIITLCFLTAVIFLACFNPFAPELTSHLSSENLMITEQLSPDEVMQNFTAAYTFQDSLLYSELLDSSFLFIYYDPYEGASGQFISWGRDEDLAATGHLFRQFDVINLIWNATIYGWKDENEGELCKSFQLNLTGEQSNFKISGRAVFSFKRNADGKWRIVRWKDESDM